MGTGMRRRMTRRIRLAWRGPSVAKGVRREAVNEDCEKIADGLHQKIAQTEVCATGSASQNPCGWLGTRCWKGGKIMSMQASTAALDPFCQEIIPPPEMRTGLLG